MVLDKTVLASAGVGAGETLAAVIKRRANIFEMTEAAEVAVLRPAETGRWPHCLRTALAARIAALNNEAELVKRYTLGAEEFAPLINLTEDGAKLELSVVVAFVDKVAANTRAVTAADIRGLQAAGIADADIVRLAELIAFFAYQIRLIAGLRLMNGAFA